MWGTGRDGQEAYDFFGDNLIFCYIDSDRQKQGAKFNGIDILSPDCLKDMDLNKYEFVVAIFRNVFMTYSVVNKLRKHVDFKRVMSFIVLMSIYKERRWKFAMDCL